MIMTNNDVLTIPVCCDKTAETSCMPITSGEPDWVPNPDQLPIAYDPDTCLTWYYKCEPEPAGWIACGSVVAVAPTAVSDQSIGNTLGDDAVITVLSNDVAGTDPIDLTCVSLIATNTAINVVTDSDGLVRSYDEPTQGSWTVNLTNGNITFVPLNAVNAGPFIARYTVCDVNNLVSNEATISVQYVSCSSDLYGDFQDTLNVALAVGPRTDDPLISISQVALIDQIAGTSTVLADESSFVRFNAVGANKTTGDAFLIDTNTGDMWGFIYETNGLTNLGNVMTPAQANNTIFGAYSVSDNRFFVADTIDNTFTSINVYSINVADLSISIVNGLSSLGGLDDGGGIGFDFDFDSVGRLWMQYGLNIYYADAPFNAGWTLFHDLGINGLVSVNGGFGAQAGSLHGQNRVSGELYSLDIATKVLTVGPVLAFPMSDFTSLPVEICIDFIRTTCDDGSVEDTLQDGVTPYTPSGDLIMNGCD